ncbi:MAG: sigma-54-dependent Fis family transcriptional regulator [Phenylobacterium sp.]|uniref:sigma-54-dependent transcriptional regulator n=1 Tax=Phenylobacterium sp. TaxID=1871053 RepID=UPI00121528C7|nr:response regulator [Phenylobacterium sp.]TAJ70840.1 MAG: sigma-54-dependent Fis family transcriptional regulator [Phenylobacterium sp.]
MAEAASNESGVILFVDDDQDVLTAARLLLGRNGFRMIPARSPTEAWSALAGEAVDAILLDLNFTRGVTSGAEGFQWLADIRGHDPDAVVVVVTGHSGINVAVAAMKAGASDFVMKPWSNARLLDTLRDAVSLRRGRRGEAPAPLDDDLLLIGDSPAAQRVRDLVARAAPTGAAVLLRGEAGTGKSLVARLLHARSGRAGPLVALDAQSAGEAVDAAVVQAEGGTLFLDEVASLPPVEQRRLLALLDRGVDVRLVSASRGPVDKLRDDLRARIETVEIALPRLAERGDDAILILEHYLRLFARRYGRAPKPLDASALELLRRQPPPGEARGLRQAAERAVVLSDADVLTAAELTRLTAPATAPATADLNLARSERTMVEAALRRHGHNVSHAARELGLTRAALYRRMVKHGL